MAKDVLYHATKRSQGCTWSARAENYLGAALRMSESDESSRDVIIDDLLVLTFELSDQLLGQRRFAVSPTNPVGAHDVHCDDLRPGA